MRKKKSSKGSRPKNLTSEERHARDCKVCLHPKREQIEQEWIGWGDTTRIAKDYSLSRNSLYRHAEMLGLHAKRRRNVRAALERMIEKAESVQATASAIVAAIQVYAQINAHGEWTERPERVDLRAVFDRMTREELEAYASENKMPPWADEFLGGTRIEAT
jgi:hypothetical protein